MRIAWRAPGRSTFWGTGSTRRVRVSTRPRVVSMVAAVIGVCSQSSALSVANRWGWLPSTGNRYWALARVVCIASAVTSTSCRGSGSSSGWKWLVSLALPCLATRSWLITSPLAWVIAASRCTLGCPPTLARLRSLPSTATAGRAGRWPESPIRIGSSQGWVGAARTHPSSRVWRSACAADGLRRRRRVWRRLPCWAPARVRSDAVTSGVTWLDVTWLDVTWLDVTWLGVTCSDVTWLGVTWLGVTWLGVTWSGVTCSDVTWLGVTCSDVTCSDVVTCAGPNATGANQPDSTASNSSASSRAGSRVNVDVDGATNCPVAGLRQQPCPASTSCSQPAAAPAMASMLVYPHATPASSTDTNEANACRTPRRSRGSVNRRANTAYNGTAALAGAWAAIWRRATSISDDADTHCPCVDQTDSTPQ